MRTLLIAERSGDVLSQSTYQALDAALLLNQPVDVLLAGSGVEQAAEEACKIGGVSKVLLMEHHDFTSFLPEVMAPVVVNIANAYSHILAPSSTIGKNLLPRIAALLDVAMVSDVTGILASNRFSHPIYAGNAVETVEVLDSQMVLGIRCTAFDKITQTQSPCLIETLPFNIPETSVRLISQELSQSERPDLNAARIVVSGGRGLQSAEQFKLVEDLADVLGAAVGASRAAVDAGFVPNDYQVGQTGKIVAPALYIAIGISGAIQHLAGMKDAKVIVAINKDEDAPIFQVADYGLVGDLFKVVPELINQLKEQ